jgi:hypothetical protein
MSRSEQRSTLAQERCGIWSGRHVQLRQRSSHKIGVGSGQGVMFSYGSVWLSVWYPSTEPHLSCKAHSPSCVESQFQQSGAPGVGGRCQSALDGLDDNRDNDETDDDEPENPIDFWQNGVHWVTRAEPCST